LVNKILTYCFLIFSGIFWGCTTAETPKQSNSVTESVPQEKEYSLTELVDSLNLNKKDLWVYISKTDFTLSVMHNNETVKTFPVVLGTNPVGDKMMQGDRKTPEGSFKIRDKYPHRNWTYFIWIDYPNEESYRRFESRKKEGIIPHTAKIGGEIGIHGVPSDCDYYIAQKINWTFGCISLSTLHIKEIYDNIEIGAKVQIVA
jgi:murein L,D-transpeptidase YafK